MDFWTDGEFANAGGSDIDMSWDGSVIAYTSEATNLDTTVPQGSRNVYYVDLDQGIVNRVSGGDDGSANDGSSLRVNVSADGGYVVFDQGPHEEPGPEDPLYHGVYAVKLAEAGRYTMDYSVDGGLPDSAGWWPTTSASARYVAFASSATNLVTGDGNGAVDVFVRQTGSGETALVSVTPAGLPASGASLHPSITHDGRLVAFVSDAPDLVPGVEPSQRAVFVRDIEERETRLVSGTPDGEVFAGNSQYPMILGNGTGVFYFSDSVDIPDANGEVQLVFTDLATGETRIVSRNSAGEVGDRISTQGRLYQDRFVVFLSSATNLDPDDGPPNGQYVYDLLEDRVFRTG